MSCTGRFAEAYDYVRFGCLDHDLVVGFDDGGGVAVATLQDLAQDFVALGTEVGMPVKNATTGTLGKVTNVATNVLTTNITWSDGDEYRLLIMDVELVAIVEEELDRAAGDIHEAMMAANACDCTLSASSRTYLNKLNVIDAAIWHNCPCENPNLSDERKTQLSMWITERLTAIADGRVELCQGHTGTLWPSFGAAQQVHTVWDAEKIIYDAELRESG